MESMRPVRADGSPLPWYTYPAIEFLNQLPVAKRYVFEYGCGHSSLYWAERAASVNSVEDNSEWISEIDVDKPDNLFIHHRREKVAYVGCIAEHNTLFDIIAIDGRWRVACAYKAPDHLVPGGLIILDNADWYDTPHQILAEKGFCRMDFNGFGPINNYTWSTSIYFKANIDLLRGLLRPAPVGGIESINDDND